MWTTRYADEGAGSIAHVCQCPGEQPMFVVRNETILNDAQDVVDVARAERNVIVWSGNSGESLFARDPRTWMPETRDRFARECQRVARAIEGSACRVLVRTHCRQVVSDIPACRWFLEEFATLNLGLCVDTASMFEVSMLGRTSDHLERLLTQTHGAAMVLMRAPIAPETSPSKESWHDELPVPGGVGRGGLDYGLLGRLLGGCDEAGSLCVLDADAGDIAEQRDVLGLSKASTP